MVVPLNNGGLSAGSLSVAARLTESVPAPPPTAAQSFDDALRSAADRTENSSSPGPSPAPVSESQPAAPSRRKDTPEKTTESSQAAGAAAAPDQTAGGSSAPVAESEAPTAENQGGQNEAGDDEPAVPQTDETASPHGELEAAQTDAAALSAVAEAAFVPQASAQQAVAAEVPPQVARAEAPIGDTDGKKKSAKATAKTGKAAPNAPSEKKPAEANKADATKQISAAAPAAEAAPPVETAAPSAANTATDELQVATAEEIVPSTPEPAEKADKPAAKPATEAAVAEAVQQPSDANQKAAEQPATSAPATAEESAKVAEESPRGDKKRDVAETDRAAGKPNQTQAAESAAAGETAGPADDPTATVNAATLDAIVESSTDNASKTTAAEAAQPNAPTPSVAATVPDAPRAIVQHLRHAETTQQVQHLDDGERMRLIQRVTKALQSAGENGGVLRLRLTPPELGAVRMEIRVRDGAMAAHLTAETETARAILLENVPALRDRLAEQSIRLERFDVDLSDQTVGGAPQQSRDDRQPHETAGWSPRRGNAARRDAPAPVAATSASSPHRHDRGGLDVLI